MRLRAKEVFPDARSRGLGARRRGPGGGGRDASPAPPPAQPFWRRCRAVTTRTTSKTVTFRRPFVLKDFACLEPAGDYRVDTEEEQLDSLLVERGSLSGLIGCGAGPRRHFRTSITGKSKGGVRVTLPLS